LQARFVCSSRDIIKYCLHEQLASLTFDKHRL